MQTSSQRENGGARISSVVPAYRHQVAHCNQLPLENLIHKDCPYASRTHYLSTDRFQIEVQLVQTLQNVAQSL